MLVLYIVLIEFGVFMILHILCCFYSVFIVSTLVYNFRMRGMVFSVIEQFQRIS